MTVTLKRNDSGKIYGHRVETFLMIAFDNQVLRVVIFIKEEVHCLLAHKGT